MSEKFLKGCTPRKKYIKTFTDGFFDCLKLCLDIAIEKRNIRLLPTTQEQMAFTSKFLNLLETRLHHNNYNLSEEEIMCIDQKCKKILWEDYILHGEKYKELLEKELETATMKEKDNEVVDRGELKEKDCEINGSCCDEDMHECVEPDWKKECIKLQHELFRAKRTIAGLEYALYNCIPHHDREPVRD